MTDLKITYIPQKEKSFSQYSELVEQVGRNGANHKLLDTVDHLEKTKPWQILPHTFPEATRVTSFILTTASIVMGAGGIYGLPAQSENIHNILETVGINEQARSEFFVSAMPTLISIFCLGMLSTPFTKPKNKPSGSHYYDASSDVSTSRKLKLEKLEQQMLSFRSKNNIGVTDVAYTPV